MRCFSSGGGRCRGQKINSTKPHTDARSTKALPAGDLRNEPITANYHTGNRQSFRMRLSGESTPNGRDFLPVEIPRSFPHTRPPGGLSHAYNTAATDGRVPK